MKRKSVIIGFVALVLLMSFQPKPKTKTKTKKKDTVALSNKDYDIKWDKDNIDLGTVEFHEPIEFTFILTNIGQKPFLIQKIDCPSSMSAHYNPGEAIAPGKSADIKFTYGSYNLGYFNKAITVTTSGGVSILYVKGEVTKKPLWNKTSHDFGIVKQGDIVETTFNLKNGSDTLQFENVQASCGCITPDWKRTPIPPNESVPLKVVFDTKGKSGNYTKVITVYTNLGLYELIVKAEIEK
jgi:hypothetical protein